MDVKQEFKDYSSEQVKLKMNKILRFWNQQKDNIDKLGSGSLNSLDRNISELLNTIKAINKSRQL